MTPEQLAAIEARDAAWSPRCQFRFTSIVNWVCGRAQEHHGRRRYANPTYDHDFTYDPDLDTSPEADRRRLLEALR